MDQEILNRMIREEYQTCEENLRAWVEAAESVAGETGELRETVFGFLFFAKLEFRRLRCYLGGIGEPEVERCAARLLWGRQKR